MRSSAGKGHFWWPKKIPFRPKSAFRSCLVGSITYFFTIAVSFRAESDRGSPVGGRGPRAGRPPAGPPTPQPARAGAFWTTRPQVFGDRRGWLDEPGDRGGSAAGRCGRPGDAASGHVGHRESGRVRGG